MRVSKLFVRGVSKSVLSEKMTFFISTTSRRATFSKPNHVISRPNIVLSCAIDFFLNIHTDFEGGNNIFVEDSRTNYWIFSTWCHYAGKLYNRKLSSKGPIINKGTKALFTIYGDSKCCLHGEVRLIVALIHIFNYVIIQLFACTFIYLSMHIQPSS